MERRYCNGYVPSPKLKTGYGNQFWNTALQTFSLQQTDGERKKLRIIYPRQLRHRHKKSVKMFPGGFHEWVRQFCGY